MAKILYFGSFGKPYDTEVYVCNTLEMLGHTIDKKSATTTNCSLLKQLLDKDYDFVMVSKGWFPDEEGAIKILQKSKIPVIAWFWDLCWGTPRENLLTDHHIFKAHLTFTSDGGDRDWHKYGVNHRTLRQGIYEPEAVKGEFDPKYDFDVVFVGTLVHDAAFNWKHRGELIGFLSKYYGNRFKMLGQGGGVRNMELNNVYASAKVVVGDSVAAPHYWSNRLYETIGRHGFLIQPMVEGLETEFTPYKHFVPYEYYDFKGLAEKIDYFLAHKDERDAIRDAGFEHCKANHTYTIRCQQLIEKINEFTGLG